MMEQVHDRLRLARESRYEHASDAAAAMGINKHTYIAHENGNRGIKRDAAIRYARFFRVSLNWLLTGAGEMQLNSPDVVYGALIPVRGVVQAGIWRGLDDLDGEQFRDITVPSHPSYSPDKQYALKVMGDSMNKLVNEGQYVQVVPFESYSKPIRDKQVVVVRQWEGQVCEQTMKRIRLSANGEPMRLEARSTNPRWKEPILYHGKDDGNIQIIAVVLGSFNSFEPED